MKEIGISVYPDFDDLETIKKTLDTAKELGYKDIFTSIELGDLGFENTTIGTVSYTHLDVYKRQINITTICIISTKEFICTFS